MDHSKTYQIAIIGGGIVGTSIALNLLRMKNISLIVIEAEKKLSSHQTGNNSGVIHSGIYYKPGSLKALNCAAGREMMYKYCEDNNIKHERCGKIIAATNAAEIPFLNELELRGKANGLKGLKRMSAEEIKEHEPNVSCIEGLLVPETGIVDYIQVTESYGKNIIDLGGEIKTGTKFISLSRDKSDLVLKLQMGM